MPVVHWRDNRTGVEGHGQNIDRHVAEEFVRSMNSERRFGRERGYGSHEPHMSYWLEECPGEEPEE